MLTVMRKVEWWGVVENHELKFATAQKGEATQVGDPVPITIQYPIEWAITAEEMLEVFKRISDKDIAYCGLLEQVGSRRQNFDRKLNEWLAEDEHWKIVQATLGDRMFSKLKHSIKQWVYNHE
jgi:hypothetical protein